MSAVDLQELGKALLLRGLELTMIQEILAELRLDICPHDRDAAFAAAKLVEVIQQFGRGLGVRSCMALAIRLAVPVLTTDRERFKVKANDLYVEVIR